MKDFLIKTGVIVTTATATSEVANLDYLWTALITLGIALITNVGTEVVKFLVAFFKKKTEDIEGKDKPKDKKEKKK